MGDGPEVHKSNWRDPEKWQVLLSGEECEICADYMPPEVVNIAEMAHIRRGVSGEVS